MATDQNWIIGLVGTGTVSALVGAAGTWYFGGRQKAKTEEKTADANADASVAKVVIEGMKESQSTAQNWADRYIKLMEEMKEISSTVTTLQGTVERLQNQVDHLTAKLAESDGVREKLEHRNVELSEQVAALTIDRDNWQMLAESTMTMLASTVEKVDPGVLDVAEERIKRILEMDRRPKERQQ